MLQRLFKIHVKTRISLPFAVNNGKHISGFFKLLTERSFYGKTLMKLKTYCFSLISFISTI